MREQLYPVIVNSSNVVANSSNSIYEYSFPAGSIRFKNAKICIASISMYYSWFNITSAIGNNTFSFIQPTFAGSTTVSVNIPDGYYDISGLNSYLQSILISNGYYLVDANGDYVYYLEFVTNSTYYSVQLNSYAIPTSIPSGYSNPASMTFPVVASTPQLVVGTNAFGYIIGFDLGTFPSVVQSTTYSVISTITPQVSPVQSIVVTCSLLNNRYSNPKTVLYSFSPVGTDFGSLIESKPAEFSFVDIQEGNYPSFQIQFLDQSFSRMTIEDSNLVVQLNIVDQDDRY